MIDAVQAELHLWTAPENRREVLEAFVGVVAALLICGGVTLTSAVSSEDFSPAWDAYVADRIAAGDIGCADSYYARIGDVESVWMNYPSNFGASPAGGELSWRTGIALHRAHMDCIKRQDEADFMLHEQSRAAP